MEPIPKIIFIIPYRNRENQKEFFLRQMYYVLEDIPKEDYKICDINILKFWLHGKYNI